MPSATRLAAAPTSVHRDTAATTDTGRPTGATAPFSWQPAPGAGAAPGSGGAGTPASPPPPRAPHREQLELDRLGGAVLVRLGTDPDQTVAQPSLERAEALPFEPVDRIAGRMRLWNRVAGQALAPVIVVTLAAGEVELALPPIERGAPVV